jgi:hypothetical protein
MLMMLVQRLLVFVLINDLILQRKLLVQVYQNFKGQLSLFIMTLALLKMISNQFKELETH